MLGLISVVAAAAAITPVEVPATLGSTIDKAKDRSGLAVYVPDRIPGAGRKVHPDVDAREGNYTLHLGLTRHCGGAGACFLASFTGERGGEVFGKKRIKLRDGIRGRYVPSACGANCAAPTVFWRASGVTYSVAVRSAVTRKQMKRIANSAIDAGPR